MRIEECDVCVVGSGAGGAVIAYEAARRGLRTLIVERGPYVRAKDMSHGECEMFSRLYKDGALQTTTSLDMFVLQGSAVGGSTTLANMVMLRPPAHVLDEWQRLGAEIDRDELDASFGVIEQMLGVTDKPHKANVSPSSRLLLEGARAVGLKPRYMPKALGHCVGCGGCNLGCSFGHKRSALETFVPWAEELGARVLAKTTILRIEHGRQKRNRVRELTAKDPNGVFKIRAKQFVIAGGAINTPGLLLKSGIGRGRQGNVGKRTSFNIGALLLLDFEDRKTPSAAPPIDDFDGDQMTVYAPGPGPKSAYTIEPVHQGPMTTALSTPGWFGEHAALMRGFRHHTFATALVPSQAVGVVKHSRLFGHEEVSFTMPSEDLRSLREGLKMTAKAYFAAGAKRVFLPTEDIHAMHGPDDVHMLDDVMTSPKRFNHGSAHPQGGAAMSEDQSIGAIDKNFALRDFENLFVCDASVFPTSVGVNPILTIMGLARYAASRMF